MISLKLYSTLTTEEIQDFYNFLSDIKSEGLPAGHNMWDKEWESKKETLPYILEKTDRFNSANGEYHILYHGSKIVACGGVYISNFSSKIGIGGVRTWVDQKYRHHSLLREYLLPHHKKWCIDNNLSIVLLTFNDYNKNIIEIFKRRRLGEKVDRVLSREPHHLFYKNLIEVEFPVIIQYTKQWVIYEKLDKTFKFDWKTIEWFDE